MQAEADRPPTAYEKPQLGDLKSRWELKRVHSDMKRIHAGKHPFVKPLQIGEPKERRKALSEGKMVFRDGETTIELPLCRPAPDNAGVETLQGIYKTHTGAYVILRAKPRIHIHPAQIEPYLLERTPVGWDEKQIANHRHESFFERQPELSHMELTDTGLRGIRLGIRAAIKTEKEQRARNHGSHEFTARVWHHWYGPSQYPRLYRKICYRVDRVDGSEVQDTHYNVVRSHLARFSKSGKWQPFDDMDRYHRIEAIDANGKARIFTFDIEDRQEIMPNRELKRMGLI